jgi:hypothetical protein
MRQYRERPNVDYTVSNDEEHCFGALGEPKGSDQYPINSGDAELRYTWNLMPRASRSSDQSPDYMPSAFVLARFIVPCSQWCNLLRRISPEADDPEGEFCGEDRLRPCVQAHRERPAAQLRDAILADVVAFAGAPHPADDITLLVVSAPNLRERRGAPALPTTNQPAGQHRAAHVRRSVAVRR